MSTSTDAASTAEHSSAQLPVLRVVRGDATPEEVAALVAVLTARAASSAATPTQRSSVWQEPVLRASPMDALPLNGPGRPSWRSSMLPR